MNERVSELMDGELERGAAEKAVEAIVGDAEALAAWRRYHLIGDAMRAVRTLSPGFAERVAARLAQEPTVLAPRRLPSEAPRPWVPLPAAIAASLAALALVGWLAFAPQAPLPQSVAPLAQAPAPAKPPAPVIAARKVPLPAGTPDYLLAHQGFSPRVSLQGMAAYARTVSDEATEAGK